MSHGRYIAFQIAEVAVPRQLFADILRLIAELKPAAGHIDNVMRFVVSRGHAFDQKPRETCIDDRKFGARRATR